MKKRLICMLLTVLMVVSLFAGAGVSASAETVSYSTMTYRMASGDYVLRICQRLGLNYYVCKPAIMKLNNIQEGQWNKLPVGKLLTLPATDADAVVIATGHGSTAATQTAATTVAAGSTAAATLAATTPSSSATTTASASGDVIWWWIVPYQLRSGETVAAAMNSLGMSASQYWDTIQKINKIKDWGSSRTDTSILLPTVYPPASGFSRVTIYAHRMLASETPANVVASRGLDYNKIKPMLDILNEKYGGVAKVQTGERLFYPIASSGKVYGKDRVDGLYGLFSGLSSDNGTVEFYVNGERVYQAKAGETVTYVIKPAKGKAVKDIVLKLSNGQGDMYLNGSSFVMPASDVTLDASFQSGHTITLKTNYEGKAAVRVDGVGVDGAAKGAKVMVVSTDPSLAVDELYVNYTTLTGAKREQLTNIDQGFVMPDYDVTVEAYLKPVPTYSLFIMENDDQRVPEPDRPINTNGRFSLEVEGAKVTSAARGAEVKIVPDADTGFTVGQIWVFRHNTNVQIGVFNNTFVMPNVEVDVGVRFVPKGNNIRINPVEGGQFYATIGAADPNPSTIANRDANAVDEAGTNVRVYLNWIPDPNQPGYNMAGQAQMDLYDVTRNSDGLRIPVTWVDGAPSFRMPAGGATVTGGVVPAPQTYTARVYLDGVLIPNGQFKDLSFYTKGDSAPERSEFQDGSGTTTSGLATVPTVVGEYIALTYNGGKHITLARYEVWDAAEANMLAEETNQAKKTECFKMPNQSVVIHAYFVSDTVKIAAKDIKVNGSGTVGMLGQDPNNPVNWISVDGVKVGEPFALSLSPSAGYFFNNNPADGKARIKVTRKDNGGDVQLDPNVVPNPVQAVNGDGNPTGEWIFYFDKMPDESVSVEVTFDKIQLWVQLVAVDEVEPVPNQLNAAGSWKVTVNNKDTLVENILTDIYVDYDDTVTISLTDAGSTKYSFVKSIINSVVSTKKSFTLSGELARAAETLNQQGQPLNVTVVLRSKSLSGARNPIALKASVNDVKRGSVGFAIINASPDYQRPVDPLAIATEAYARDTVAIIPQAVLPDQYMTDAKHIRVNLNGGGYIEPTGPVDANGDGKAEEYTFVMPEGGYSSIKVDFIPVSYNLTVNTDPAAAAKALFEVSYQDYTTNNDVLLNTSFKQAPFGSKVKVTLTDAGKKLGVQIDSIDVVPTPTDKPEAITNGFQFTMPAANTTVTVKLSMKDNSDVPTGDPDPVSLAAANQVTLKKPDNNTISLALLYKDKNGTIINEAKPGETVTVEIQDPTGLLDGYEIKGGVINFRADGKTIETAAIGDDLSGSFTMPSTAPAAVIGDLTKQIYKIKVTIADMPEGATVKLNNYTVWNGAELDVGTKFGDALTVDVTGGTIDTATAEGTALPKKTGGLQATGTVPAAADGKTINVIVSFTVPEYTVKTTDAGISFHLKEDCSDTALTAADMVKKGTTVYIKGTTSAYVYMKGVTVTMGGNTETIDTNTDGIASIVLTDNITEATRVTDKKAISVEVKFNGQPEGFEYEVQYPVGTAVSGATVSNVNHSTSDDLKVSLKLPGGYKFTLPTSTKFSDNSSATNPEFTINWANVSNGENVVIELGFNVPPRSLLPITTAGTTIKYYDKDGKDLGYTVPDGTQVYVGATHFNPDRYVNSVTVLGKTISAANAKGYYGPFTITADVLTEVTDIDFTSAEKAITLVFHGIDKNDNSVADDRFEVWLGTTQVSKSVPNITSSSTVTIKAVAGTTLESFSDNVTVTGTIPGTSASVQAVMSKVQNGDKVDVYIYVS